MKKRDLKQELEDLVAERDQLVVALGEVKDLLRQALIVAAEEGAEPWDEEEDEDEEGI